MLLADMQCVVGPGLGNVNESWVLFTQHRVVPQIHHPQHHQKQRRCEAAEEERAVLVRPEASAPLRDQDGDHGEEGEEEELCDLSFCHQIP